MLKIRSSVFETNSSSTHSLSISKSSSGILETIVPSDGGVITLANNEDECEFGWQWEKYNDAWTKANYCAIFARDSEERSNLLIKVIKDHTGAKEIIFGQVGYIDHQSGPNEGGLAYEAFSDESTLKNFLFNKESYLFIGNDNESAPSNFYDVGFGIEYRYKLSIEGHNEVLKYENNPSVERLEGDLDSMMERHPKFDRYDYSFTSYDRKTKDGKIHNSLSEFDENIILIFKFEGWDEKLLETKKLKFKLEKI